MSRLNKKTLVYILLAFAPIAFIADQLDVDPVLVFIFAGLGVIPLADFIGEATEELAANFGPRVGGLLNATFGNAAELIITIFALKEGLLDLVRASIIGSMLGNLLLVLGLSLLLGGLKNGIQKFDRRQAALNSTMLMLAVIALMIPSLFSNAIKAGHSSVTSFNESVAVVMMVLYGLSVLYSFATREGPLARESTSHEASWSMSRVLATLVLSTAAIAVLSEVLVGAVEPVVEELGLSQIFLGIIVIPIVGNVAEHLVAVEVAIKNKMELSLAVSLGSSLQIALFVAPLLVFISLLFDETLLLVFSTFELVALFSASLVVALVALDGESNWLEGAQLLSVYTIIGLAFYFLPA